MIEEELALFESIAREAASRSNSLPQTVFLAQASVVESASEILKGNLERALQAVPEFGQNPDMSSSLRNYFSRPERIHLNVATRSVTINADRNINYYWGIKEQMRRAKHAGNKVRGSAADLNHYWRGYHWADVYHTRDSDPKNRYYNTIAERESILAGRVPYWVFLEYGVKRDYPTPFYPGTHFVRNTEVQASDLYRDVLDDLGEYFEQDILVKITEHTIHGRLVMITRDALGRFTKGGFTYR